MTIGSVGSAGVASNVSLQKKSQNQEKAVIGTILEGVKETPRPDGKGVRIDKIA